MDFVRTPDERFAHLPDYDFAPHYAEVDGLRVHYVDEGPRDAAPVLLMHGEPSWSFLYRKMIPIFVGTGHRAIAPDLVGFGRSDKPVRQEDYSYARHVEWMRALLFDVLDLRDITLVCQDWGGLIGLRLAGEHPDRFARLVPANTALPEGHQSLGPAFDAWRKFSQESPDFPVGAILQTATVSELSPEVMAAYDAPFPSAEFKAGARRFPMLVPVSDGDPAVPANRAAWKVLERFEKPVMTAFSDGDPITGAARPGFETRIPGAQGQPHTILKGGGHFLQEDVGPQLAALVNDFIARTS
jgi:haloalkane dehalogenase